MAKTQLKLLAFFALGLFLLNQGGAEGLAAQNNEQAKPDQNNGLWRRGPAVTIPLTLIRGIPFVKLSVNGHNDELFMIDSGAEGTLLNSDEAARLKIQLSPKPIGYAKGHGDSAGQPMWVASSIKLKFGRKTIAKGNAPATSLFSNCGLTGVKIAGVLGYDLLRGRLTVIDYPNGKFMIFEKNSFIPRADRHIQALSVDKAATLPVFSTTISVNGKDYGTARVVVDTGAEHGAMLFARFAERHSINELGGWKTGKNCGIGGLGSFLYGLHGSAVVGQEQVALPDIAVMLNKNGIAQSDLYDAFLGGAVLARWSIVFDIPNGKIYLLDRSDATPPAGSNAWPAPHP